MSCHILTRSLSMMMMSGTQETGGWVARTLTPPLHRPSSFLVASPPVSCNITSSLFIPSLPLHSFPPYFLIFSGEPTRKTLPQLPHLNCDVCNFRPLSIRHPHPFPYRVSQGTQNEGYPGLIRRMGECERRVQDQVEGRHKPSDCFSRRCCRYVIYSYSAHLESPLLLFCFFPSSEWSTHVIPSFM